ncbi:ABC transporter permease [Candidatus Parcubacteria bacterium]|nr:ABC transporter permease [Patescibacteria group bacterium]MCG2689589.1 ABC transporter permease [Candidatus Parcubacteria bacterium]
MVIYTLWLRQIKRYARSRSRIIGALGQPALFMVALGFGFGPVFAKAGAGNYLQFLVPGVISQSVLFTSLFSGIEVIWDKQFGFLKETLVAPVSRLEIIIGRTLGGATVATFQGLLVFIIALLIGFKVSNWLMLPLALVFIFLIALTFTALGTAIASKLEDMQGFQLIMNFLVMPMFFLSGALFPLNNLPKAVDVITRINPLTYGVDGLRAALTGTSHFGILPDFAVLSLLCALFLTVGSWLFSKTQI